MSAELIAVGLVALAALAYLVRKLAGGSHSCAGCPYRDGCNTVGDRGCPGVPPEEAPAHPEDREIHRK